MRFFEPKQHEDHIVSLQDTKEAGIMIAEMTRTRGWKLLYGHLKEQVAAYQLDVLTGCKDWEEYLEKKSRARAINLLLTDIEEYMAIGDEAAKELKEL